MGRFCKKSTRPRPRFVETRDIYRPGFKGRKILTVVYLYVWNYNMSINSLKTRWHHGLHAHNTTTAVGTERTTACRPTIQSFTNRNHLMLAQSSSKLFPNTWRVSSLWRSWSEDWSPGCQTDLSTTTLNFCPNKSMAKYTISVVYII